MKKEFNITEWILKNRLKEHEGEEYPPYMYSPVGFSCAVCKYHYMEDGKVTGYKACGREEGEKRSKYQTFRHTPAQFKTPGKGNKRGKTK
jgi:hypothetical protein